MCWFDILTYCKMIPTTAWMNTSAPLHHDHFFSRTFKISSSNFQWYNTVLLAKIILLYTGFSEFASIIAGSLYTLASISPAPCPQPHRSPTLSLAFLDFTCKWFHTMSIFPSAEMFKKSFVRQCSLTSESGFFCPVFSVDASCPSLLPFSLLLKSPSPLVSPPPIASPTSFFPCRLHVGCQPRLISCSQQRHLFSLNSRSASKVDSAGLHSFIVTFSWDTHSNLLVQQQSFMQRFSRLQTTLREFSNSSN